MLGVVKIQTAEQTSAAASRVGYPAALGGDVAALADSVQDERDLSAGFIGAGHPKSMMGELAAQYATTSTDLALVQKLDSRLTSAYPAAARSDLAQAIQGVQALPDLRGLIHSPIYALPIITDYSNVTAELLAFDPLIAEGSSNAQVAQTVTAL